jgi:ABC-2 type transport system ATP-binding protein
VKDRFARERVIHFQLQSADLPALREALDRMPKVTAEKLEKTQVSLRFDRFHITASEVASAVMRCGEVVDFRIDEPGIEHVIKQVYEGHISLDEQHAGKEAAAGAEAIRR